MDSTLQTRTQIPILVYHGFSSKEQGTFNFMAAVTICSYFGAQENKVCCYFHCSPIYLLWSDGTVCHIFFWMLSFKPPFWGHCTSCQCLYWEFYTSLSFNINSTWVRVCMFVKFSMNKNLDSVSVVHRVSCSELYEIFLDQGLNLCPQHCKAVF